MQDDFIRLRIDRDTAVALAYFDVFDRVALMGKDLTTVIRSPAEQRPIIPAQHVDYEYRRGREKNGTLTLSKRRLRMLYGRRRFVAKSLYLY